MSQQICSSLLLLVLLTTAHTHSFATETESGKYSFDRSPKASWT